MKKVLTGAVISATLGMCAVPAIAADNVDLRMSSGGGATVVIR